MTAAANLTNVSPSIRLEHRFFSLVRWFGLLVTALTLVSVVVIGVIALGKLASSADERIKAPSANYADFQRSLDNASKSAEAAANVDPTLQRKEQEAARAVADLEYSRRLKPHLDTILTNLSNYAAKLEMGKPAAQAVGDFVRENMAAITGNGDSSLGWGYVEGLEKATSDLASDSERLAKLGAADPRRARWDQFLQWYTNTYESQIGQEHRRVNADRNRVAEEKQSVIFDLYKASVVFGIFVLATILLVLLRIEKNTRQ